MRSSIITVVNGTASNRANEHGRAAQVLCAPLALTVRAAGSIPQATCGLHAFLHNIRVHGSLLLLCFTVLFVSNAFAGAESSNPPAEHQSRRFLIVIETSRSMKRRLPGTEAALKTLLDSSLARELHPGDTLGMWTFNEELTKGKFPLQRWSSEKQASITALMLNSVRAQKFEKTARLASVMPALNSLVEASEDLTVILFADGTANIWGTPFDEPINKVFQQWREEEQRSRLPFVTVLRARDGKFVNFALAPAPWPVVIPPFKTDKPAAPSPVAPVAAVNPSADPPPHSPPVAAPRTNPPGRVMPQGTAARSSVVPTNLNALVWETNFQQKLFPDPPTLVFPSSSPALIVVGGSPGANQPTNQAPPPAVTAAAPPTPVASEPPANQAVPPPHPNAMVPVAVVVPPSDTNPAAIAAPPIVPAASALTNEVAAARPAAAEDSTAANPWFSRPAVQVTGFLLLAAVFGLALFFLRRSRSAPHISLITRSIGPKK